MNPYVVIFLLGTASILLLLIVGVFLFKLAIDTFGGNIAEHEQGGFEIPVNLLDDDTERGSK